MTTPEQLQAWREKARAEYLNDDNIRVEDIAEEHYVAGYLRAKQETEQAIKDARKQALEDAIAIYQGIPYQGGSYMEGVV